MEQFLRTQIEQIIPLTDQDFDILLSYFVRKKYKKHQFLIQEGEPVPYLYFIEKGLVKLVYTDDNAKQHIVDFAMEGWWETDLKAYYTQSVATMSLECIEDTQVYGLDLAGYNKIRKELPQLNEFILDKTHRGFIAAQQRILSMMKNNTAERFKELQERFPGIMQRVPKSLLAAYLGVSRETLSRLEK
ncbi:Crp/Fnr family transcriptional regulator [Myroides odoratimimus]|uniref:Crp/Fnr family transcriptional regulator n=1 Tax=Myroides odoratimimus TaxID=76832 RepID=UPI0029BFC43D|nr:Crp/Fnr family transcriptional regulator [Myroides odoratimimus]MDX4973962.1 Crp/Fnr family transcriptional regulator [Myroides odoratimimus]